MEIIAHGKGVDEPIGFPDSKLLLHTFRRLYKSFDVPLKSQTISVEDLNIIIK